MNNALPDTSDNFRKTFGLVDHRISNNLTIVLSQHGTVRFAGRQSK